MKSVKLCYSASTESGPYRMEKPEGDTASQEVLE